MQEADYISSLAAHIHAQPPDSIDNDGNIIILKQSIYDAITVWLQTNTSPTALKVAMHFEHFISEQNHDDLS